MLSNVILMLALLFAASNAYAEMNTISKEQVGDWDVQEVEDGLTSEHRWIAMAGNETTGGLLIVKCDTGKTGVYVQAFFLQYMGGDFDERAFTYRVDSAPPVTEHWQYKEENALLLNKQIAWEFVQKIRDGKVLRFRGQTYEFESVDAKVPIAGARDALKAVYSGCGDLRWKD